MKKESEGMDEDAIPEGTDLTNKEKMIELYERLKANSDIEENVGLTRVARVLAMWLNTDDFERTAEYAHGQADMDALYALCREWIKRLPKHRGMKARKP